jgi:hypothetical protein
MAKVTTKRYDFRAICIMAKPDMYAEKEPAYDFSNGRKFTKPNKTKTK